MALQPEALREASIKGGRSADTRLTLLTWLAGANLALTAVIVGVDVLVKLLH